MKTNHDASKNWGFPDPVRAERACPGPPSRCHPRHTRSESEVVSVDDDEEEDDDAAGDENVYSHDLLFYIYWEDGNLILEL